MIINVFSLVLLAFQFSDVCCLFLVHLKATLAFLAFSGLRELGNLFEKFHYVFNANLIWCCSQVSGTDSVFLSISHRFIWFLTRWWYFLGIRAVSLEASCPPRNLEVERKPVRVVFFWSSPKSIFLTGWCEIRLGNFCENVSWSSYLPNRLLIVY